MDWSSSVAAGGSTERNCSARTAAVGSSSVDMVRRGGCEVWGFIV